MEQSVREEVISKEVPEFLHLLEEMKEEVLSVTQHVDSVKSLVEREEFNTEKGVSLLELKNHLMLSYLINVTQVALAKTEGQSVSGCTAIQRLVEIRTVLEKVRPLDQKLRYQIDKLIRTATTGMAGAANDPLRFKPNPANLVSKLGEGDSGESEGESGEEDSTHSTQPKAYVPPKVVAMPYEEDGKEGKRERSKERLKRRALQSSIVQDLRDQYLDTPEEVHEVGAGLRRRKKVQEERERERFEEANFLRLPQRKRRGRESGRGTQETAEELTDFSALRALMEGELPESLPKKRKRGTKLKLKSRKGKLRKGPLRKKH